MMSLRAFHLFFIVLSIVLAGFFSAWLFGRYRAEGQIAFGLASLAVPHLGFASQTTVQSFGADVYNAQ